MRTELWCLVANALWGVALVMLEILAKTRIAGPAWNAGNRDEEPEVPAWVKRAGRALGNHKENFPLFLTAVLVVQLAGKNDAVTAGCAVAYVAARALHGVLYVAGVAGLRTVAFLAGFVANLVMLSRLL